MTYSSLLLESKVQKNITSISFSNGLTVSWPVEGDQASWRDVTMQGSLKCTDLTPDGAPVEFTVNKESAKEEITLQLTKRSKNIISVQNLLKIFRLSTRNFSNGEPNNLGFENAEISKDQMDIVIIPNEAMEMGISGKLSSYVGHFDTEEDIFVVVQHMQDNLVPAVALMLESGNNFLSIKVNSKMLFDIIGLQVIFKK